MKGAIRSVGRSLRSGIRKLIPAPVTRFRNTPSTLFEALDDDVIASAVHREARAGGPARSIIVRGWRFLPHSYAIVNQWQLLSLLRRSNLTIKVQDAPLYRPQWRVDESLFDAQTAQALKSIAVAAPDESADVTLKIAFPYDFSPSPSKQTAVFGTSEHQVLRREFFANPAMHERFRQGLGPLPGVRAITPSQWSAEGFYKSGFRPEQVLVIPHGVDVNTFRPMPKLRSHIRRKMGVADDQFVFLAVGGAMTSNKGVDLLLWTFAEISRKFPGARLVLKGVDSIYNSKARLCEILQKMPAGDQRRVISRLLYFGESLPNSRMALLYQAADAYVSPYRAEGFNMPVLEAASCGVPIICTRGGSTDDFVTDEFAWRIESSKRSRQVDDTELFRVEPNIDHLVTLMAAAIQDASWRRRAAEAGPAHVRAGYSWDRVVDRLVEGLFN